MKRQSLLLGIGLITLMVSCGLLSLGGRKELIVTREYMVNPNFGEYNRNFGIQRLRLKDGVDSSLQYPENLESLYWILDSFEIDPRFDFYGSLSSWDEDWKKKRIYFNQKNEGFSWRDSNRQKIADTAIGNLEVNTWYRFHRVYSENVYMLVCYVDSNRIRQYFMPFY